MRYILYIVIVVGTVCGVFIPQLRPYKITLPFLVGFILALNFFEIKFTWQNFFRKELAVTVLLSSLIMPLVVYHLLSKGFPSDYRIGLLLTAIAPSGIMPLVLSRFVPDIDTDLILSNFFVTTFGSILYLPPMVKWLAGATIQIPATQLLLKTAAMILLPYGAGVIMKSLLTDTGSKSVKKYSQPAVFGVLFVLCAVVGSSAAQSLAWDRDLILLGILVGSIYLIQGSLAYLAGLIFWNKPVRNTLAWISSSRNNQITLGIAVINFSPATAIPCIFGYIFHHSTNAICLWLFRK